MSLRREHVVVVGAGIAGLTAAYRLGRSGYRVTVLECQRRVGGRAWTLQARFACGLVAQAGPARFPSDHARVQRYADAFGLKLVPFYPAWGTVVAFLEGVRVADYRPSPEEFWGYARSDQDPRAIKRISASIALAARHLTGRALGHRPQLTYGIRGGTELLTDALTNSCGAEIRLGTSVERFDQDASGIRVQWSSLQNGGGTLRADIAICAAPLSALPKLTFSPDISAEKHALSREVRFSSAIRIFLQMRRPYWQDEGHNGFAVTDTLGEIWAPHFDGLESPSLLVCYAKGDLAQRLSALGDSQRIRHAISELERIFPGAGAHFEHGASFCWNEQSWIRGGWPQVRAGFAHRAKEFRRPEERLYFAGDYASLPSYLNMVEGAIESGEHVAEQICQRI